MSICYLNGELLPLATARISVLDRGFIFGDGVYEVIPIFDDRPFRLDEHLTRLARSLDAIALPNPHTIPQWRALVSAVVTANPPSEISLYIQVTRGPAPRNHAAPIDPTPTVFAMVSPLTSTPAPLPVATITLADIRWARCDIKAVSLLPNVMFRSAAQAAGAYEALLIRDGWLTEGAASNVFVIADGRIKTPPHSCYILPGVTRDVLVTALKGSADEVLETAISKDELLAADEVWLTSSTRDLVPVASIDGCALGAAAPGPVFRRVTSHYTQYKRAMLVTVAPLNARQRISRPSA
ncbi:MAG: aminotransferase class IV [Gammaproteobacteria bacterium]|nr:aminotransferase class IV [Gammaproteobacteria bacterium]